MRMTRTLGVLDFNANLVADPALEKAVYDSQASYYEKNPAQLPPLVDPSYDASRDPSLDLRPFTALSPYNPFAAPVVGPNVGWIPLAAVVVGVGAVGLGLWSVLRKKKR